MSDINKSHQQTRDALSSEPSTHAIYQIRNDDVKVKIDYILVKKRYINHAFIYGHPTNGVLGIWTNSYDGQQLVLGDNSMTEEPIEIIDGNNFSFTEDFSTDTYKDSSTTANWDTNNEWLYFSGGGWEAQVGISLKINPTTSGNIIMAKLSVNRDTSTGNYYLSADGGNNWEEVTSELGQWHTFTNSGNDLRWKISSGFLLTIYDLTIEYVIS